MKRQVFHVVFMTSYFFWARVNLWHPRSWNPPFSQREFVLTWKPELTFFFSFQSSVWENTGRLHENKRAVPVEPQEGAAAQSTNW